MIDRLYYIWQNQQNINDIRYTCGYCGTDTSPARGWVSNQDGGLNMGYIAICTYCNRPSFIEVNQGRIIAITPTSAMGKEVAGLPENINKIYSEARNCTTAGAFTAAVLICRKLLMHIAVDKGASPNLAFIDYVQYLADKGYIPPDGKDWVDHIRAKSNEANHEIVIMLPSDAEDLITFIEMLLRLVYEFKQRLPKPPDTKK